MSGRGANRGGTGGGGGGGGGGRGGDGGGGGVRPTKHWLWKEDTPCFVNAHDLRFILAMFSDRHRRPHDGGRDDNDDEYSSMETLHFCFDADEQQLSVRRVNETKHVKLNYAHSEQSVCTRQLSNIIKLSNNLTTRRRRTTGGGGHMKQCVLVTDSMQ